MYQTTYRNSSSRQRPPSPQKGIEDVRDAWPIWHQTYGFLRSITAPWPVPNYTTWRQGYVHVNKLPEVTTWKWTGQEMNNSFQYNTLDVQYNTKRIYNAPSAQAKTGIRGARGDCYWEWSANALEKSSCLRSRLRVFKQAAVQELKDRSFQIFGALTENALSAMTRDAKVSNADLCSSCQDMQ